MALPNLSHEIGLNAAERGCVLSEVRSYPLIPKIQPHRHIPNNSPSPRCLKKKGKEKNCQMS
jgi:hypothetical protein